MIDIHSHILPGVDDGAKTMEEAVEIVEIASACGVTTIVATPHFMGLPADDYLSKIQKSADTLIKNISEKKICVDLIVGAEVLLFPELPEIVADYPELTIGRQKKYLLFEFPFDQIPPYVDTVLFQLLAKGITPIIAHPERHFVLQRKPQLVIDLIHKGVLTQCNTGSLLGKFGKSAQKSLLKLLDLEAVHAFASDTHSVPSRGVCSLAAGRKALEKRVGEDKTIEMMQTNPGKIIRGKSFSIALPEKRKKRLFFGLFGVKT